MFGLRNGSLSPLMHHHRNSCNFAIKLRLWVHVRMLSEAVLTSTTYNLCLRAKIREQELSGGRYHTCIV